MDPPWIGQFDPRGSRGQGADPFDINVRSIIAFREMGRGHTAMESFFGFINCVPHVSTHILRNEHWAS